MPREHPTHVDQFLESFAYHAKRLIVQNPNERNADIVHRVAEQIFKPWEHDQQVPKETKQTGFLRDYFNQFYEILVACQHLDTVRDLIESTMRGMAPADQAKVITFWSEAYLNEVYIFRARMHDFLTFTERRYKKDPDFSMPLQEVCGQCRNLLEKELGSITRIRGAHVHAGRSRYSDPQLVRLLHLDFLVNGAGIIIHRGDLDRAAIEARKWLIEQTDYFTELAWRLFDGVCEVLAEGIITSNGWLIVPTNFKD